VADIINEHERLQRWIVELFSPVTAPTRLGAKSVRFGPGELDFPGMFFSHWAIIRGLVWAFQDVAPTAWSELKALAQDAVDEMVAQWAPSEEPDRLDQLFLAHVDVLSKDAGLSGEIPGLQSVPEEIVAWAQQRELLTVPNVPALQEWRARWNLAGDHSLFTAALVAAALNEIDLGRHFSPEDFAKVTFAALFKSGLPNASEFPGSAPQVARSLQTALSPPYPQTFRFEFSRFNPFFETADTFEKSAREAFKREFDAHIADCRAALSAQEVAPVPVKRVPDIHFRWYVRYQVLEQSHTEIADAEYAKAKAVSRALKGIVDLAGVPRRGPGRPGPKKKPTPL
jgi:hypothetical protein